MNSEAEAPGQPKSDPKRPLPDFLAGRVSAEQYAKWLKSKAGAHVRRDRKRKFLGADLPAQKDAIHAAVVETQGRDACTAEELRWELLCAYDNDE